MTLDNFDVFKSYQVLYCFQAYIDQLVRVFSKLPELLILHWRPTCGSNLKFTFFVVYKTLSLTGFK